MWKISLYSTNILNYYIIRQNTHVHIYYTHITLHTSQHSTHTMKDWGVIIYLSGCVSCTHHSHHFNYCIKTNRRNKISHLSPSCPLILECDFMFTLPTGTFSDHTLTGRRLWVTCQTLLCVWVETAIDIYTLMPHWMFQLLPYNDVAAILRGQDPRFTYHKMHCQVSESFLYSYKTL